MITEKQVRRTLEVLLWSAMLGLNLATCQSIREANRNLDEINRRLDKIIERLEADKTNATY